MACIRIELRWEMTGIVERMDSLSITRLHVFAGLVCAFALGADLMDMSIGSALTAVFSATPHPMDPKRLGWLISSVYVGAVLGGPALGWVADRRGFKRVTVAALSWVGLTSMLAASSDNTIWLSVVRLLSGLALGAIPPLIIAYLTAIAPSRVRGLYIFWICAISFLAAPAPIFMIRWLTPLQPLGIDAWRWPFAVAGLLSFGASAAFVRLPESPRWLLNQHRFAQAASVCEKLERSPPVWGRRTESCEKGPDGARELTVTSQPLPSRLRLMGGFKARFAFLVALYFLHPWATLGFSLLTGPILLARGYDLKDTLLFVGMATFGPSLSTWIAGLLIDRLQRSTALALSGVLMLAAAIVFFTLSDRWLDHHCRRRVWNRLRVLCAPHEHVRGGDFYYRCASFRNRFGVGNQPDRGCGSPHRAPSASATARRRIGRSVYLFGARTLNPSGQRPGSSVARRADQVRTLDCPGWVATKCCKFL
jgi:putative MFS transporter